MHGQEDRALECSMRTDGKSLYASATLAFSGSGSSDVAAGKTLPAFLAMRRTSLRASSGRVSLEQQDGFKGPMRVYIRATIVSFQSTRDRLVGGDVECLGRTYTCQSERRGRRCKAHPVLSPATLPRRSGHERRRTAPARAEVLPEKSRRTLARLHRSPRRVAPTGNPEIRSRSPIKQFAVRQLDRGQKMRSTNEQGQATLTYAFDRKQICKGCPDLALLSKQLWSLHGRGALTDACERLVAACRHDTRTLAPVGDSRGPMHPHTNLQKLSRHNLAVRARQISFEPLQRATGDCDTLVVLASTCGNRRNP